jgi:integrase
MQDHVNSVPPAPKRPPWNKGKLIGAKPPLRQKHVWAIRTKLQIEQRRRDLAMFNLAIDSKLRGCDVVALKVQDVAPNGYFIDRATVRQKKTGRPVRFELTEQTRQAVDDYIRTVGKKPGEFLFTPRRGQEASMTTRQYARLVSKWISSIGLDPHLFGTHSLRRTKATLIYRRTGNYEPCSYCSATRRLRAPSGISALRLMTPFPSRNRSTSDLPGRSGPFRPTTLSA